MDEEEFWQWLEKSWEKGRVAQVSGVIDFDDPAIRETGRYLQGHALLPRDYNLISEEQILQIGSLLLRKGVAQKTKEAVMMILAHQPSESALALLSKYNLRPDPGMEYFARAALEECAMWNE
ncbi:MAG: hypothetical protein WC628_05820 [Candidatus Omnitrophota bacterium]